MCGPDCAGKSNNDEAGGYGAAGPNMEQHGTELPQRDAADIRQKAGEIDRRHRSTQHKQQSEDVPRPIRTICEHARAWFRLAANVSKRRALELLDPTRERFAGNLCRQNFPDAVRTSMGAAHYWLKAYQLTT